MLLKTDLSYKIQKKFKIDLLGENIFLKLKHICPYQLGNKCSKETIFKIFREMRNIFQFCLYISCMVTIKAKSNAKIISYDDVS